MRTRTLRSAAVAGALALSLLAAACGGGSSTPSPSSSSVTATTDASPAEPGEAPAVTTTPAGVTYPIGTEPEGLVVGTSGIAAVGLRNPDGVALVDVATGKVKQFVPTQGSPRHLELAAPDGPVIVPLEQSDTVEEISLSDGSVSNMVTGVGRNPHDANQAANGTIVVANELGGGVIFLRDGKQVGSLPPGPVQPGGVAIVDNYAAVSDVRGLGIWVYDVTTGQQVAQQEVGQQLTHAIALAPRGEPSTDGPTKGVVAVADTVGGAVYLEKITPQVQQVARIDGIERPYGMAFDAARNRLYVALSGQNLLRTYDVSDPANPKALGDVPTAQQPNAVAVDPQDGSVLVTGTADGLLQVIPSSALPA